MLNIRSLFCLVDKLYVKCIDDGDGDGDDDDDDDDGDAAAAADGDEDDDDDDDDDEDDEEEEEDDDDDDNDDDDDDDDDYKQKSKAYLCSSECGRLVVNCAQTERRYEPGGQASGHAVTDTEPDSQRFIKEGSSTTWIGGWGWGVERMHHQSETVMTSEIGSIKWINAFKTVFRFVSLHSKMFRLD